MSQNGGVLYEQLRPCMSRRVAVTANMLVKETMALTPAQAVQLEVAVDLLEEVRAKANLLSLSVNTSHKGLTMLGMATAIQTAQRLLPFALERAQLRAKTLDLQEQKKQAVERSSVAFVESFEISAKLVGLAIGKKGINIKKVKDIPGVFGANILDAQDRSDKPRIVQIRSSSTPSQASPAR